MSKQEERNLIKRCISKNWKFSDSRKEYIDIDLPHDYAIGKKRSADGSGWEGNGYYPDSKAEYVKYLSFDKPAHYILDIDGAYMCSQIFMNENYIASHPYGYTPFLVELTPYIIEKTNKISITTNPIPRSSRWYSGNGIYRDVFLWEGGDVRIEPWDMFISTLEANEKEAKIKLGFDINSDKTTDVVVRFEISFNNEIKKTESINVSVKEGVKSAQEHIIEIENPDMWSNENPALYTLKTEIFENNKLLDTSFNDFGIRTIFADAKNGLLLNGKPLKLRGGCIHHDHGVLGAMAFPAAEERKIRLLKESGFNAVRIAHNPPSLALLEICDRMGMIVMDEAFDCWNKGKTENDYHLFFEDWCLRDISYMVKRDRNHPCVFSYSIGNEILEIDGTSNMAKWSETLSEEIRKYDNTRFVTSGIQKVFAAHQPKPDAPDDYKEYIKARFAHPDMDSISKATVPYEEPLDIVGCNYYYEHYLAEHERYPDRVIWGSETHAVTFYDSWKLVRENNYIIGDFNWTAIDNMGEVGAGRSCWARDGLITGLTLGNYPWRNCYQGDLDLCGNRRPQSYFREAVWLGNTQPRIFVTHPEHFGEGFSGTRWHWYDVDETWSFDDKYIGRPVKVETYTDADKIEWYINGRKIGESIPEKAVATINTIYERGEITAVAYKNGEECARYSLVSSTNPAAIDVTPEKTQLFADNRDLCYFNIEIKDREGRFVALAENELHCVVQGGELMGIFSANPCSEDQFTSDCTHAFKGRALAIVRAKEKGTVTINVFSDELASGCAKVIAK